MKRNIEIKRNNSMTFLALLMLFILALPHAAFCTSVRLDWDPSTDEDLAGYKVYYQADSAALPFHGTGAAEGGAPIDVANTLSTVLTGLDPANSYYFAVTVYNSAGVESVYSNIIEIPEAVAPSVAISSPANNASVQGTVAVSAAASDNKGVARVEFYLNGAWQATDATAPYGLSWDTSSLAGGEYTLTAKAFDAAGNVGQSEVTVNVAGDSAPPTVAFVLPGNNASVHGSVTISASAADNVGVSRIEIYQDQTLAFASNENPASFSWNSLAAANGIHSFSAKAYDAAGNVGEANLLLTVANDSTAPSVALTAPASGATVSGLVTVSATATDNLAVTKVELYLNGILRQTVSTAPYSFSWNTTALANGLYLLRAKAYDAAGNVGQSADLKLTVSNGVQAPSVSITAPTKGATVSGSVAVSASATDNEGVTKVEFYVNGLLMATSVKAPYGFLWNSSSLANGAYTVSAKAYDAAGNVGVSAGVAVNVLNDKSAPVVTLFSMPTTKNSTTVPVLGLAATDNVKVAGYLISESATAPAPSAAGWSATAPTSFTFAGTGLRTAYAWAKDAAGNVSAGKQVAVLVDTTLPMISSMSLASGSSNVTVKVSATDNVAVARMELYLDNSLLLTTSANSFSYVVAVSSGSQVITVKVYDTAGNVRTRSLAMLKS